ncbi:MAG TPA: PAS domain S-box protein [Gemmatimonadaceae bacterium]
MNPNENPELRRLFDDYLQMYLGRDDLLTAQFSENFSGFTGGGDFLVKDRDEWVAITRLDFAQVKDAIRIELKDVSIQSLAETIAVATGFFVIHLPIEDHILSRETARLVLIFRKESGGWKIAHSSISIPYYGVQDGEVYPLTNLVERNRFLEQLTAERTAQLSAANDSLRRANEELTREIAERQLAERALLESEARYRSILLASPDDITIADPEGRVVMVSPMAMQLFGYAEPHEFIGRPVTDFIVPEDRARAMAQVALRRQGVRTGASEYHGLRLDGTMFDIEVNSEFMRDAEGTPTGLVVIVRDITARKQVEAEKERLEAMNRQLQKSESLGRMAGAIAHHFNNQLQAVMMGLEAAMTALPAQATGISYLADAMTSARRAAEVSTQMLTYLGQSHGQRERQDLCVTCRHCLPLLRVVLPQGTALETTLPSPGPQVHANANQIQQVLANLVTNAVEARSDGPGEVHLTVTTARAADVPATNRFPIDWQPRHPSYACIEVADTGSGIAAGDIEQLFDPFFSSKFTGRGLGLPVVLGFARAHGGVVHVESRPGRTVFRVYMPVTDAAGDE